ncbi:MAG: SOS response-associated peptidase, partial [Acidimicrobiales bacterium]
PELDQPRFNVAPTDPVAVVATSRGGARRVGAMSWGLVPRWEKALRSRRLINLRSETLLDRPGFRTALERRRCIVPADGFYEWKATGDGARQPHFIRACDGRPLALAGLWDVWRDPAAGPDVDPLRTCTILTTSPNEAMARLHDRMPVVLARDDWELWLDRSEDGAARLAGLLRPCPSEVLEVWPVGPAVNSVRNDGPHLIEPVAQ